MQKSKTKKNKLKVRQKKGRGEGVATFLDGCMGVETQKHGKANKDLEGGMVDGVKIASSMHLRVQQERTQRLCKSNDAFFFLHPETYGIKLLL